MPVIARLLIASLCLVAYSLANAAVVRVEVTERSDVDATGYEQIAGRLHFEIDPAHPRNRIIADADRAPKNAAGRVAFSSDLRILKPKRVGRSNGAAWIEIPNRGGKSGLSSFFTKHGFTVMQVGWEFDVPARAGKLRIEVPAARENSGAPIRGVVCATFTPSKRADQFTLGDLADYPPVDAAGPDRKLIVRAAMAFPAGKELPRSQWRLEGQRVTLDGGFEPGKTYEIAYLAENPPVAGLGLAAIRDAVAWLKHDAGSLAPVRYAYAFGSSQCGRLLREFVYLGFNTDEQGRLALDGVMAHVAGAGRLDINRRWSVPRAVAAFETASYPFTDTAQPDPVTGIAEGVQENPRVTQRPKIFYTNTAAEYWGAGRVAGLSHTTADGTRDAPLPDNVRSYFFAGTQHGATAFPPKALAPDAPFANPVNPGPVVLALRLAMHRWVTAGTLPPPSAYPKLSDGTLVGVSKVRFPALPGIASPRSVRAGVRLRNPLWPHGVGAGTELPLLVPQVDRDGNDLAGIRMSDVSVPLASSTGWIFRPASMGAPHELLPLQGSWIPLAATRAQREQLGDPRPAIDERYATKEAYLARVCEAVQQLIQQGYLQAEDLSPMRKQAEDRWDWVRGADDGPWNRFRGPNGSGISHARTVPVRWTEADYNWKVELPGLGHSSPVIWGKRIFVTCGEPVTALRTLLCLDAVTSRTLWKREYPSKTYRQHRDNNYASATPAVDADGVVITWSTPEAVVLLALDLEGHELWRRDLGPLISIQGSASSPILYADLVVLANDQEDMQRSPGRKKDGPNPTGRSFVIAVDRKTGKTRWQTERKTFLAGYSTPCVYQGEGGRAELIFSSTAHGIMAVDPANGKINWEFGQPFMDRAVISPVTAPGLVIDGHGAGLRGTRCIAVRPGSGGRAAPPSLAYSVTTAIPMVPTPLVKDGRLFLWADDGVVSCLRVSTGETVWRQRVEGAFYASPIWIDRRLYNVSKKGEVVVLSAEDKFQVLSRVPLGEPSYATPAVAGGVMYLRTRSHLFSLGGPR